MWTRANKGFKFREYSNSLHEFILLPHTQFFLTSFLSCGQLFWDGPNSWLDHSSLWECISAQFFDIQCWTQRLKPVLEMGSMLEPMDPWMKCPVFPVILGLRHPFLHSNIRVQKEEYNYNLQMTAQSSCSIKSPLWLVYLWWNLFDTRHHGVHCSFPSSSSYYLHCHTMGIIFFLLLHSLFIVLFCF